METPVSHMTLRAVCAQCGQTIKTLPRIALQDKAAL
jgi:hypothetical protein